MNFRYSLTLDDVSALSRYHYGMRGLSAKQVRPLRLWITILWLPIVLMNIFGGRRIYGLFTGSVVVFVILALPWVWTSIMARRRRALIVLGQLESDVAGPRELIVDDEGVTERTELGEVRRLWSGIERVDETRGHVMINYGQHDSIIIPKSWLGESVTMLQDALRAGMAKVQVPHAATGCGGETVLVQPVRSPLLKLDFTLTPEDYAAFAAHMIVGKRAAVLVRRARFIPLACVVVPTALRWRIGGMDVLLLVASSVFCLSAPWLQRHASIRNMRALARAGVMKRGSVGPHSLLVDENGVLESSDFGYVRRYWGGVDHVEESPTHLFILFSKLSALIIPIAGPRHSALELRQLLAQRVPAPAASSS